MPLVVDHLNVLTGINDDPNAIDGDCGLSDSGGKYKLMLASVFEDSALICWGNFSVKGQNSEVFFVEFFFKDPDKLCDLLNP